MAQPDAHPRVGSLCPLPTTPRLQSLLIRLGETTALLLPQESGWPDCDAPFSLSSALGEAHPLWSVLPPGHCSLLSPRPAFLPRSSGSREHRVVAAAWMSPAAGLAVTRALGGATDP